MMDKKTNHNDVVVAVDIGTTKVCAIAARKNKHGKVEIIGLGKETSEGVLRGVVSNIDKTVNAISEAISKARAQANMNFNVVHVGIAGQHIQSLQQPGMLSRKNNNVEISLLDIEELEAQMHRITLPPGDKIIHVIPQEYKVDGEIGILDPIGMSGNTLEANFHIITGQISASHNIYRCVERTGLQVAGLILEPIASAEAVLSTEEKQAGVVLVDIGGGTTDITIFKDGIIRHTAVLPFGGDVITKDIIEGCNILPQYAEKLKLEFGSALAEEVYDNRIISVPGLKGHSPREISEKNLAHIIQARVEEILDCIIWEIRRSGYESKLIGGIVLTGGGSLLLNIEKLTALYTGLHTRIGTPIDHLAHGYLEQLGSPIFSTAIGLLLKGFADLESGKMRQQLIQEQEEEEAQKSKKASEEPEEEPEEGGWLSGMLAKAKNWFETAPDSDF